MLRRVCVAVSLVVAVLAVASSATGGPATSMTITWVLASPGSTPPSADVVLTCGDVPAGMWVRGTGTWTLFEPTGAAGNIQSTAHGTAVDSGGNPYTWNYRQSVQPIGNSGFSRVVDDFVLSGSGPAGGIHSHFIAVIDGTSVEDATLFEPLLVKGDPFSCDPI